MLQDLGLDRSRVTEVFKDFGLGPVCFPGERPEAITQLVALEGGVTGQLLAEHPKLQLVIVTEPQQVNLQACRDRDLTVCLLPPTATDSMAELALGLMLALLRRITVVDAGCREGRWGAWPGGQLAGRTIGIAGTGAVGTRLAKLLVPFGVTLLGYSSTPNPDFPGRYVEWAELFARSAIVSLHLPITDATRRMVALRELERLGVGALLINVAHPDLVHTEDLILVLETGRLGGAGLDLPDPLPREHPLTALSQVILTPGIGWRTEHALEARLREVARHLSAFTEGRPLSGPTLTSAR